MSRDQNLFYKDNVLLFDGRIETVIEGSSGIKTREQGFNDFVAEIVG